MGHLLGEGVELGEALGQPGLGRFDLFLSQVFTCNNGFDGRQLLLPRPFTLQRRLQPLDLALQLAHPFAGRAPPLPGRCREAVVPVEVEDAGEDLLPLPGLLLRELVGAALQEERRVDKRLVVEPERPVHLPLRVGDGALCERAELGRGLVPDLELQTGLPRLPALGDVERADDAVALPFEVEDELDLHLARADAEELLVRLAGVGGLPRLAPDRPRDRVEQGGLPLPVPAREAGDVELVEVERLGGRAVGEEVAEPERNGDHARWKDAAVRPSAGAGRYDWGLPDA